MKIFYCSKENLSFSYTDLLEKINSSKYCFTNYKALNYFDFTANVLLAIACNKDVVLHDFESEKEVNNTYEPVCPNFNSVEDLINAISESKSSIGISTSGTEGSPKLVFKKVESLIRAARINTKYQGNWGFTTHPAHISAMHLLFQVLFNQGGIIDLRHQNKDEITSRVETYNIEYISATPTFYRMLAPADFELPMVKNITLNGELATEYDLILVKQMFPKAEIKNVFGSTETGSLMSTNSTIFTVPDRLSALIKVIDEELHYHSSLLENSNQTNEWSGSGDLVETISESPLQIRFLSRKSEIINIAGHNVNPKEVEAALLKIQGVIDARVYSKPHALVSNVLIADVKTAVPLEEKHLRNELSTSLSSYKVPRIIKFVDSISVGKTGKKVIKLEK